MKLPLEWLKEYTDCPYTADQAAEKLTLSGTKVEDASAAENVLDLEITTNRPDCLSILGLAREIAALTGKRVREPQVPAAAKKGGVCPPIRIEDKKACSFYTARVIRGVDVKAAPEKARRYLELSGTRAISNVVDATNFVLFEAGQPLHAFDLDKLRGGIQVRDARAGEKILGIDGIEYTLDAGTLVIADDSGPVAVAGVIGGKATEVTASTRNILLESAYFDPQRVRRASRRYKISTESSYRFERGVDPQGVDWASRRAAALILDWAGGELSAYSFAGAVPKAAGKPLRLRMERLEKVLGMKVPPARVVSILSALGFRAKASGKTAVLSVSPSFRRDVAQEADLIEEVLRIEGFDKIPLALPPTRYSEAHLVSRSADLRRESAPEIKKHLAAQGFQEIISYSLLSARALSDSAFDLERYASNRIANPVSAEQEYLRPSLLPGSLAALAHNVRRKAVTARYFEIGRCYRQGRERTSAGLLMYGQYEHNWRRKSDTGYHDLKGVVENLCVFLGLKGLASFAAPDPASLPCPRYGQRAELQSAGGSTIGLVASVHPSVLQRWDISHDVFYAEIDLEEAFEAAEQAKTLRVRPVPKFPSVRRDIAIVVPESVAVARLETTMRTAAAPYLAAVELFDEFTGKNIAQGKRSLAFALEYQSDSSTFTDEQIAGLQKKVGEALEREHRVEFRS